MRQKKWNVKSLTQEALTLSKTKNLSAIFIQILLNRDINESELDSFLFPSLLSLHDSRLLPDINLAVDRIKAAVLSKEKVLVVGDYDVDGVTSLAIFFEYSKQYPNIFNFYIPHRVKEGYGLNRKMIKQASADGVSLILAFDCGTNSIGEVGYAKDLGIDIVIVDHHQPNDLELGAAAFVNPKRKDSKYPFYELSSGGLSFKLLQLLKGDPCWSVLDLVALSIICDVVPITGENRILLKEGLKKLQVSDRKAIKALCKAGSVKQESITPFHIGYVLGPRINASGRIAHAQESLEFFLTDNEDKAESLALKLHNYNKQRRVIETEILSEIESNPGAFIDDPAIIVAKDGWHLGVLGIVASRLAEKYSRPCFVISFDDQIGRGSARSPHNLHLINILNRCCDFLAAYGGHKKAAGIQITKNKFAAFKENFNAILKKEFVPSDFFPVLTVDLKLQFKEIDNLLADELLKLAPLGEGVREALFYSNNVLKKTNPKKNRYSHSVWLSDGNRTFEAIVSSKDLVEILNFGDSFDIVYSISKNTYHDIPRLILKDCRLA